MIVSGKNIFFGILFFGMISEYIFPQSAYIKNFAHLSRSEKCWAAFHPFCALKVKKLTKQALVIVNEVKEKKQLDQYENGGKLDAFRHTYTMALLSQKIKIKKLRTLGKAHEKGNYLQFKKGMDENGELPDSISCEMDLRNNEIGFETGSANKKITTDSLKKLVVEKIKLGQCWKIFRNSNGNYISCDEKEILMEEWKGKWSNPKCLVKTDKS